MGLFRSLHQVTRTQRLLAEGIPGTARIHAVGDTGATLEGQPVCELSLEVTIAGRPPYRATVRQPVPRLLAPRLAPGGTVPVRVDPADPAVVVADLSAPATAASAQDPVARLERLAALRAQGLLTDQEFAAQKARVLEDI
jgi:hypothetical protein